ncbi:MULTISPECIES: LysR family transcriptional regulator [Pseudomonas]|uniref:LysR family transcriptional regulator n=1 Tax=Pseudomonas putida TaxID=303 RepID=A0A2S3XCT1_PSEPU|nr:MULTISPECIES: LysR substrate-binding domain-containing protein [Pseudomonas]AVD83830.1 LysR family transcriptional regulator [Pseudomonas sp. SWI6]AVD95001.1 LysR family transcriptional regulator [Pseudomonas sp. SWI36]ELU0814760.1 LysR family transcriptional regulator [Pseudomonas putida]MBH3388225.1 LysR family transcriptional regulator [Pseudomonas putida]MCK2121435.1 LysR substrate-binding domain-containing protein [Pseudomonas sp. PNPG3]
MDLRQLRYFVRVVECGNITRASEGLHIAQPAISQQIRNLEEEMSMKLLERSVHGVEPTAAGRTLYRHAIELLRQADATRELLLQDAEYPQGRVSVGMPSSTARMLAMPLARMIRSKFPGIKLELFDAPSADIEGLITTGRVAMAVMVDAVETRGIATQHLLTERLYLMSWPELQLPDTPISIEALSRLPLVLPCAPNGIRSRVEFALQEAGQACQVEFEVNSTDMLLLAVKNELGVTVLPWAAAQDNLEPGRITLREIDHRLFVRELSLCWHEAGVQSNAVDKVRQTIVSLFAGFKETGGWSV